MALRIAILAAAFLGTVAPVSASRPGFMQEERACSKCGHKNLPAARFCGGCGNGFGSAPEKKDPPRPVTPQEDPLLDGKREPRGIAGVGLTAEKVNRAIDRGADNLVQKFKNGKYRNQEIFLIGLALAHADRLEKDPEVFKAVMKAAKSTPINNLGTYQAGILAMLLDHLDIEKDRLAMLAKYFVETQGPNGTWGYGKSVPQLDKVKPRKPFVTITGGIPIDLPGASWKKITRENPPAFGRDGDNSCTQYAVLGLRSAMRRGILVPEEVWRKCYDTTSRRFNRNSAGWGYTSGKAYGSMTSAAATTMAICGHYLGKNTGKDPWIRAGRKWVALNFKVNSHPGSSNWLGYYLYSLERLGRISGQEFFGDHEWYPLGARYLVGAQAEDGSWDLKNSRRPVCSTSFALLFLTRATPALVEELKRGGNGTLETEAVFPGQYFHIILDASGSMMARMNGRTKIEIARDAIGSFLEKLDDGVHVGLRVYGHTKRAIEPGADIDSRLEIPMSPLKLSTFRSKLRQVRCRGKTPLTYSLEQSIGDLKKVPPGEEFTLILLTDGMESDRRARPAEASARLSRAFPKMRFYVIGFDLEDPVARRQLERVAASGKGLYVPADDHETLAAGFVRTIRGADRYVLLDGAGKSVAKGNFGDRRELKEGRYTIVFTHRGKKVRRTLWVNTDRKTRVVVDLRYQEE